MLYLSCRLATWWLDNTPTRTRRRRRWPTKAIREPWLDTRAPPIVHRPVATRGALIDVAPMSSTIDHTYRRCYLSPSVSHPSRLSGVFQRHAVNDAIDRSRDLAPGGASVSRRRFYGSSVLQFQFQFQLRVLVRIKIAT